MSLRHRHKKRQTEKEKVWDKLNSRHIPESERWHEPAGVNRGRDTLNKERL